jgi:protein-tyrosine phosphatase
VRPRFVIVFVCTGNTCRSPLAEVLCKQMLAQELGCTPERLPASGYEITSAGVAAIPGMQASEESVVVAKEYGADLSGHTSRFLTDEMVLRADYVLAMTQGHLHVLNVSGMGDQPRLRLLARAGTDITDPIGGSLADYRTCAQQIHQALAEFLAELRQRGELPRSME